jgi:site-specific DNA-methyltransferase (adenine-specific)
MRRLGEGSIDMVVTSPPYDDARVYKNETEWEKPFSWINTIKSLYRVMKPGGVVVWIVNDMTENGGETLTSFRQALHAQKVGFRQHDTMIWNKGSFAFPSNGRYHQTFEYMFIWSKGKPKTFNPLKDRKNKYLGVRGASGRSKDGTRNKGQSSVRDEYGMRFNVWDCPVGGNHCSPDKEAYEHPAIFPESLVQDHILTWSNPGDTVYDPFMGSGTTAKMAMLNDRAWIGSEYSKEYCEIAVRRLKKYGQVELAT